MRIEAAGNLDVDEFLGWKQPTQEEDPGDYSRLRYVPEDGKRGEWYSSWEELIGPRSVWSEYFVDPGKEFDIINAGRRMHGRQRKRMKAIARFETLKNRRVRAIESATKAICVVRLSRHPLSPDDTFLFEKAGSQKRVGMNLGDLVATVGGNHESILRIANTPRFGINGGIQEVADLLGMSVFATNNKYVSQEYHPRRKISQDYVD